jgi:hypothetical protein
MGNLIYFKHHKQKLLPLDLTYSKPLSLHINMKTKEVNVSIEKKRQREKRRRATSN